MPARALKTTQERNAGRDGRESDGDIALVGRKLHVCGAEEVGLQLFEEMVAICGW